MYGLGSIILTSKKVSLRWCKEELLDLYSYYDVTNSVTNLFLGMRTRILKLALKFKILNNQIHIPLINFSLLHSYICMRDDYQYHYVYLQCYCEDHHFSQGVSNKLKILRATQEIFGKIIKITVNSSKLP